jgi:hypothetical protein
MFYFLVNITSQLAPIGRWVCIKNVGIVLGRLLKKNAKHSYAKT